MKYTGSAQDPPLALTRRSVVGDGQGCHRSDQRRRPLGSNRGDRSLADELSRVRRHVPPMVGSMINEEIKALVQGKNFATISTLLPSGQIQTHVVWVDCDDDHIVINTEVELRKFKNVQADPRATVTIWDKKNPYYFAEVRGRVRRDRDWTGGASEHRRACPEVPRHRLSRRVDHSERVILRIAPDSQILFARGIHDVRR